MAKDNKNQQPKQQYPEIREIRLDQIGRDGSFLVGRVAASVKRGNNPETGYDVFLSIGGIQTPNSPLNTDEHGEVADDFRVAVPPEIHRVQIEAKSHRGFSKRRMVDLTVAVATPPPKTAFKPVDKLDTVATGSNGHYIISVTASAQDGSPITGAPVVFNWDGHSETKETEKGVAKQEITFEGKSCTVEIQHPGIKTEILRLIGPRTEISVPPIPEDRLLVVKEKRIGDRIVRTTKKKGIIGSLIAGIKWGMENRRNSI